VRGFLVVAIKMSVLRSFVPGLPDVASGSLNERAKSGDDGDLGAENVPAENGTWI
jgi:hypothetical protein